MSARYPTNQFVHLKLSPGELYNFNLRAQANDKPTVDGNSQTQTCTVHKNHENEWTADENSRVRADSRRKLTSTSRRQTKTHECEQTANENSRVRHDSEQNSREHTRRMQAHTRTMDITRSVTSALDKIIKLPDCALPQTLDDIRAIQQTTHNISTTPKAKHATIHTCLALALLN